MEQYSSGLRGRSYNKMSKCKLKDIDIEYAKDIILNNTSLKVILNKLGYSISKSTNICKSTKNTFKKFCENNNINISYLNKNNNNNKHNCKICGRKISNSTLTGLCHNCWVNENRRITVENWLKTGNTNCSVQTTIRNSIRDYIYKKQNYKCSICGLSTEWNNKKLNFILDHIDGDASNNKESNLRLICPNCDSQLDTFKSKNKKSKRRRN